MKRQPRQNWVDAPKQKARKGTGFWSSLERMLSPPRTGYRLAPALAALSYSTELLTARVHGWAASGRPKSFLTLLPPAMSFAGKLLFIFVFVISASTPVSAPVSMPEGWWWGLDKGTDGSWLVTMWKKPVWVNEPNREGNWNEKWEGQTPMGFGPCIHQHPHPCLLVAIQAFQKIPLLS